MGEAKRRAALRAAGKRAPRIKRKKQHDIHHTETRQQRRHGYRTRNKKAWRDDRAVKQMHRRGAR